MSRFAQPTLKGPCAEFYVFNEMMDNPEPRDEWELNEHGPSSRLKYGLLGITSLGVLLLVNQIMRKGEDLQLVSQSQGGSVNKYAMIQNLVIESGANLATLNLTTATVLAFGALAAGITTSVIKRNANRLRQGYNKVFGNEDPKHTGRAVSLGKGVYVSSIAPPTWLPPENVAEYQSEPPAPASAQSVQHPFWAKFIDYPPAEGELAATHA